MGCTALVVAVAWSFPHVVGHVHKCLILDVPHFLCTFPSSCLLVCPNSQKLLHPASQPATKMMDVLSRKQGIVVIVVDTIC